MVNLKAGIRLSFLCAAPAIICMYLFAWGPASESSRPTEKPVVMVSSGFFGTLPMVASVNQDIALTQIQNRSTSPVRLSHPSVFAHGGVDVIGVFYEPPQGRNSGSAGGIAPSPLRIRNGREVTLRNISSGPILRPGESGYVLVRVRLQSMSQSAAILQVKLDIAFVNGRKYPLTVPMPVALCRGSQLQRSCAEAIRFVDHIASNRHH